MVLQNLTINDKDATLIVGIGGGPDSGKTEFGKLIAAKLKEINQDREILVNFLHLNKFYKCIEQTGASKKNCRGLNLYHPDAIDWELLEETLKKLTRGEEVKVYDYDLNTYTRKETFTTYSPSDVIVIVGDLLLYSSTTKSLLHMKVYLDVDDDTRLSNRVVKTFPITNPIDLKVMLDHYVKVLKPSFEAFVSPSKANADIIVPRGKDNVVALQLIVNHISSSLNNPSLYSYAHLEPYLLSPEIDTIKPDLYFEHPFNEIPQ